MAHKRKHPLMTFIAGCTVAGLIVMLTGCGGGLPKELKKEAKALPDLIKTGLSLSDQHKDKYIRLTASPEFKPVQRFAEKENWVQNFDLANDAFSRAKEVYEKELSPLLSKNRPELAPQVTQQVTRIHEILKEAENFYQYPVSRFSKIRETILNADTLHSRAQTDAGQIQGIAGEIKAAAVAKAIADFPDLSDKINARFAPLAKLDRQSRQDLSMVEEEYSRHAAGGSTADYAAFTDSAQALSSGIAQARTLEAKITGDMDQLYSSYTKILKDMKEEYFVTIKRESWDENSDYYDPQFTTFQRQVDPDAYEVLTSDTIDEIAVITMGFFGTKLSSNIGDLWNELSIDPVEQWPKRGHNAASFSVEDSREAYFHKYILEENGETRETDWEPVDESVYEANLEFLGMAIMAKPYGVFEQDRLVQAAPPGLAYVGNAKYGEWKQDDKGDRFWSWYGKYAFFSSLFFFPPSYYPYNSWNSWNTGYRNNRPYFGQTQGGIQQYGTHGSYVKQSPKFQSSTFAKSGGFKSQTASVRGAGANLRGGGPKSKGK